MKRGKFPKNIVVRREKLDDDDAADYLIANESTQDLDLSLGEEGEYAVYEYVGTRKFKIVIAEE